MSAGLDNTKKKNGPESQTVHSSYHIPSKSNQTEVKHAPSSESVPHDDDEKRGLHISTSYVANWIGDLPAGITPLRDFGKHQVFGAMSDEQARIQRIGRGSLDASGRQQALDEDAIRRHSAVDAYRRASAHSRSPSMSDHSLSSLAMPMNQPPRSTPRQSYSYYPEDSPQYGTQTIQNAPLGYTSDYSPTDQTRTSSYSYPSGMTYNMAQPTSPYEQPYPPRQNSAAAIEVLSSQFAGVPQYYAGDVTPQSTVSASQQPPAPYQTMNYSSPAGRQTSLPQNYGQDMNASMPTEQYDGQMMYTATDEESEQRLKERQMQEAYVAYETALKTTFQFSRDGQMPEAGDKLLQISDWLLSHAVDLGLVRDEQEHIKSRTTLWTEFNTCWLSTLDRQKQLVDEQNTTGQLQAPQDVMRDDQLEKMGRELVRLCDNMERHGLVDYQMGVWEEEILEALQQCLDQLEAQPTAGTQDRQ